MRRRAGFNANQAWRQLLKESQDVATLQLPADNYLAAASTPWTWKTDLAMSRPIVVTVCMVAPLNRGSLNSAHIHGTHVPGGGAVHSINRRHRRAYSITSSASANSCHMRRSPTLLSLGEFALAAANPQLNLGRFWPLAARRTARHWRRQEDTIPEPAFQRGRGGARTAIAATSRRITRSSTAGRFFVIGIEPIVLDCDIPAFDIAGFAKSLEERDNTVPSDVGRSDVREGYHWHRWLLGGCR